MHVDRRFNPAMPAVLLVITVAAMLSSPVNPWPIDGWFQTQYVLFEQAPGADNYTPIAAPAIYYKVSHWIATVLGLDLAGEFYVAANGQYALLFLSVLFVYRFFRLARAPRMGVYISIGLQLFVLSTGLPQAFWSENVCLFLTAATLLLVGRLQFAPISSPADFWGPTILMALTIGLLVVTRIVPVFLIPVVCALLYGHVAHRQLVACGLTMCVVSAALVVALMAANEWRFGRFEMTSSSGRHLWQGVYEMADVALANSPEYQALKALDPGLRDWSFWNVPMPAGESSGLARDAILGRLAKQAITERPGLYLKTGMTKFVREIGRRSGRLGFLSGAYNPLNRQEFLPSPAEKLRGYQPWPSRWISALLRQIHKVSIWLYPVLVYLAFLTFAAIVLLRVYASLARRKLVAKREAIAKRLLVAGMFSAGVVALVVVAVPGRSTVDSVITSALCLMLLVLFLKVMSDRSGDDLVMREGSGLADARAVRTSGLPSTSALCGSAGRWKRLIRGTLCPTFRCSQPWLARQSRSGAGSFVRR